MIVAISQLTKQTRDTIFPPTNELPQHEKHTTLTSEKFVVFDCLPRALFRITNTYAQVCFEHLQIQAQEGKSELMKST